MATQRVVCQAAQFLRIWRVVGSCGQELGDFVTGKACVKCGTHCGSGRVACIKELDMVGGEEKVHSMSKRERAAM
jgi:hypothetical protein